MIHKLKVRNFKALTQAQASFERLALLIGPNACGKTSLLEAVDLFCKMLHEEDKNIGNLFAAPRHEGLLRTVGADGSLWFRGEVDDSSREKCRAEFVGVPPVPQSAVDAEADMNQLPHWNWQRNDLSTGNPSAILPKSKAVRFDPASLAAPHAQTLGPTTLSSNGEGLATVLVKAKLNDESQFHTIMELVKSIVPSFVRVRFKNCLVYKREFEGNPVIADETAARESRPFTVRVRGYPGYQLVLDFSDRQGVPATLASEGTLLALGLVTTLICDAENRILLIDDVDRALHPRAQRALIEVIRKALGLFPDLQIIATTHSPYLLNCLEYDEVRVMHRDDEGLVRIGKFAEHPDFERWKEEFSPGEFWSLVGEDWLAKTLPKAAQP